MQWIVKFSPPTLDAVKDGSRLQARRILGPMWRAALLLVVVVSALMSLTVSWKTPAWESNDEPDHVRNVELLVSGHWYRIEPNAGYAPHQPPLYYLVLAGVQKIAGRSSAMPAPQQGDPILANGLFSHQQPQESRDKSLLWILRVPSIFLGALTIVLTGLIGRLLADDDWVGVAAAAAVGFLPKFVFSSSFVNNDVLATALGAAATYLALKVWKGAASSKTLLLLGVALGAAVVTKLSVLPLVGVLMMASLWSVRRNVKSAASLVIPFLFVSGPLFLSNKLRYGDPLAATASVEYFRSWIPALVAVPRTFDWFGKAVASGFATSFWYTSGWNQFRWKAVTYVPLWALVVVGGLGHVVRRERKTKGVGLLALVFLAACSSVWLLAWNTTQWQARIAFPGLAAFGAAVASGWKRWGLPRLVMFVLPTMSLVGTLYAIRTDVFGRY